MDEVARFFSGSVPLGALLGQQSHFHTAPIPQLALVSQNSHSEEVISKNGIQKTIHIVVKNSPFHIQLGLANPNVCKLDFNQIAFDAQLIYDCEGDKEVDYVKVRPFEFKSNPSETGNLLDCELRIKVLTSQHEDMLFKVRILGRNPMTQEDIPGLSIISAPIKVISKPEQIKKKQPSKKRSLTDMLIETVNRIEKKQEEQQKLIEKMLTQQVEQTQIVVEKRQKIDAVNWEEVHTETSQEKKAEKNGPEFEDAFSNLVKSYNSMKQEEKPEVIRKIIRNSSTRDTERLSELLDLFWTEGLQKELGGRAIARERAHATHGVKEDGCTCSDCPHKLELERIDEFYKEFLSSGVHVAPEYN